MLKTEEEIKKLKEQLNKENYDMEDFKNIIRVLRSDAGCPWDRVQTHESIRNCLIEECYEVVEAVNNHDSDNLKEELGDVLFQVVMHSIMEEEQDHFCFEDVVNRVSKKMIYRHPGVFGDSDHNDGQSTKSWDELKKLEKEEQKQNNAPYNNKVDNTTVKDDLSSIPSSFPALIRAQKVLKKSNKINGDLKDVKACVLDIQDRLKQLKNVDYELQDINIHEFLGQTLLDLTNIACRAEQNAENSLTNAVEQFI